MSEVEEEEEEEVEEVEEEEGGKERCTAQSLSASNLCDNFIL